MNIIFEDNHLLVVEKPPRLPVQKDKSGETSLVDLVKQWLSEKYAKKGNVYLGLLHRLDRPVGGLLVVAKTSKAASRLSRDFREGRVSKRYLAMVAGDFPTASGVLEAYMDSGPQNKSRVYSKEQPGSKYARLAFKKMARSHPRYPDASFLEIDLDTGRKHQIRAQLAFVGHPIVGDRKYGSRLPLEEGKIALIAYYLKFQHPVSGEEKEFRLPLSESWPKITAA